MSGEDEDGFAFAPPPFKPADAMQTLKRELRASKLTERGEGAFELKGQRVVELQAADAAIGAKLAKRPSQRTPEWTQHALKSGADVRDFVAAVRRQLARWASADE